MSLRSVRGVSRIAVLGSGLLVSGALFGATIVIGQVAPMSGLEASVGRAYSAGVQLYFNQVNKAGGIHGNTLVLSRKDDRGHADEALSATKQLLAEQRPLALVGYVGNRSISALIKSGILEREKIPLVGYRGADIQADTPFVYSVRAGLTDEIRKIAEHLATVGITRLGIFYEESPQAGTLVAMAEEVAKSRGLRVIAKAGYQRGTVKAASAVDTFLTAEPQAIIVIASSSACATFVEQYRMSGGGAQLFTNSEVEAEVLTQRLGLEHMQSVAITQVTPNPYKISLKLTQEFSQAVSKTSDLGAPVSYAMLEGYIAAKVLVEAIRRTGPKVNRENLVNSLDHLGRYDLGGYLIDFRPAMHAGSKFVELSIIGRSGRLQQ